MNFEAFEMAMSQTHKHGEDRVDTYMSDVTKSYLDMALKDALTRTCHEENLEAFFQAFVDDLAREFEDMDDECVDGDERCQHGLHGL